MVKFEILTNQVTVHEKSWLVHTDCVNTVGLANLTHARLKCAQIENSLSYCVLRSKLRISERALNSVAFFYKVIVVGFMLKLLQTVNVLLGNNLLPPQHPDKSLQVIFVAPSQYDCTLLM